MKKFFMAVLTTAILFVLTSTFSAFAWENQEASLSNFNYYDLNEDGRICVSDLVICRKNACMPVFESDDAGNVMTAVDLQMMAEFLLTGKVSEISYEENSIDEMEPSDENIEQILDWASGVIVDVEVGEVCPDSVRIRVLRNGIVSEISCERISETSYNLLHFDYNGRRITLGVTEDGLFAWDTCSFDISPNNFNLAVKVTDEENENHEAEKWEEPEYRLFNIRNPFTEESFQVSLPRDFDVEIIEFRSKVYEGEIYRFKITKIDEFHFTVEELIDSPYYIGKEMFVDIR